MNTQTHQATHTPEHRDSLVRERFFALGRAGANADINHPDRKEWERLRAQFRSSAVAEHKKKTTPKFSFNYPFLTENALLCDVMQIVPTGYQDVDRGFDEATGRWIASALNEHNDPVRKAAPELLDSVKDLLEALRVINRTESFSRSINQSITAARTAIARATGGAV